MILSVTGKKREANVPDWSQHTITEKIKCETWDEGSKIFLQNNPGYEITGTSLLVPDLKKFIITCNAGSLSGSGGHGSDIEVIEYARDVKTARSNFNNKPDNNIYGRQIKSIREATA
jgi:hypothetical protein